MVPVHKFLQLMKEFIGMKEVGSLYVKGKIESFRPDEVTGDICTGTGAGHHRRGMFKISLNEIFLADDPAGWLFFAEAAFKGFSHMSGTDGDGRKSASLVFRDGGICTCGRKDDTGAKPDSV